VQVEREEQVVPREEWVAMVVQELMAEALVEGVVGMRVGVAG